MLVICLQLESLGFEEVRATAAKVAGLYSCFKEVRVATLELKLGVGF